MTKRTTQHSNISLPLLVDYVKALLPTLTSKVTQASSQSGNSLELLWVAKDKVTLSSLQTQLDSTNNGKTKLTTLPILDQQQTLERYELVCFWLPTLPEELIQYYIPLLMRYRDLYAAHLLIAIDSAIDLRAYGFTPFNIVNQMPAVSKSASSAESSALDQSITLWQFNLYDYKVLPNWLNSKYWANPENWNRGRW
ncbi:DUF6231 family protein [Psychrobacter sp. DM4]|uniref:DUF6231 family protein n=1 Tax=Psychrobacter sp. DM4 TaxID=3440637 RepID=UPI003F50D066